METWQLFVIPVIASGIGWFTNWLAVWMTFYPLRFVGIGPYLGWQGILPSKSEKMARIVSRRALGKLGTMHEYLGKLDQETIVKLTAMSSRGEVHDAVDQVMRDGGVAGWSNLPEEMRMVVYSRVQSRLTDAARRFLNYVNENVERLLSLEELSVDCVRRDHTLVNRIFKSAGDVEFRFIVRSGLWIGALLGSVLSVIWAVYPAPWVLPAGGFVIGYLTNWIALNIIFRPLEPRQLGPVRLQGIFLRRQEAVAAAWARMATREVLTLPNILRILLEHPDHQAAREEIRGEMRRYIRATLNEDRAVLEAYLQIRDLERAADMSADISIEVLRRVVQDPQLSGVSGKEIEKLIRDRMCAMSPAEFQDVLRPAFQEEEIKLIVLGAMLGMLAGFAQLAVF